MKPPPVITSALDRQADARRGGGPRSQPERAQAAGPGQQVHPDTQALDFQLQGADGRAHGHGRLGADGLPGGGEPELDLPQLERADRQLDRQRRGQVRRAGEGEALIDRARRP